MRFTVLCYISTLFHTAGILSKNSSFEKKTQTSVQITEDPTEA